MVSKNQAQWIDIGRMHVSLLYEMGHGNGWGADVMCGSVPSECNKALADPDWKATTCALIWHSFWL